VCVAGTTSPDRVRFRWIDALPLDTGDDELNWTGCFIPGSSVLRNRVGATSKEALAAAENDLVEVRVAELRENSGAVKRTYDLVHLKALHRYLFRDVYP
jgi:cell filamentation protein